MKVSLIAALSENNVIGKDNELPWHISADLRRFKELTTGHPIIMGRKTYESLPTKPLPNRTNIILSRDPEYDPPGAERHITMSSAFAKAKEMHEEIFVIGGAEIYEQTLPLATRLYLTLVHQNVDGDAFFPSLPEGDFVEVAREEHADHDPPFTFLTYDRQGSIV